MMKAEEIAAIPWNDIGHTELIALCRNWHDEKELFRRILMRALELVFIGTKELADEIGDDVSSIEGWIRGENLPQEGWMLLILTDVIQVRLEAFRDRLATSTKH